MQNHHVNLSKYHFWTRNMQNSTKSRDLVMSGPVQENPYGPQKRPYGPIWTPTCCAVLCCPGWGPYGPLWGPYGSSWTGPDMTKSRLLVQFRTFRVQNKVFGQMRPGSGRIPPNRDFWFNFACFGSKTEFLTKFLDDSAWFCVEKLKKHGSETKKPKNKTQNLKIGPKNPAQD